MLEKLELFPDLDGVIDMAFGSSKNHQLQTACCLWHSNSHREPGSPWLVQTGVPVHACGRGLQYPAAEVHAHGSDPEWFLQLAVPPACHSQLPVSAPSGYNAWTRCSDYVRHSKLFLCLVTHCSLQRHKNSVTSMVHVQEESAIYGLQPCSAGTSLE